MTRSSRSSRSRKSNRSYKSSRSSYESFLHHVLVNKTVLIVITIIAILNLIGYLVLNDIEAAIMFILIAVLTYFFSKNMIIVFFVPLLFVNLFRSFRNGQVRREGYTNNSKNKNTDGKKTKEEQEEENKKNSKLKKETELKQKISMKSVPEKQIQHQKRTNQGLPITPVQSSSSDEDPTTTITSSSTEENMLDESFEVGRNKRGYNIDYASTVEDAYDQLNQILGSDGIKNLTKDTQKLMNQQLQLAESMKEMGPMIKGMAPLIDQAKSILSNNGENSAVGLGNLTELAKKFSLK